MVRKCCSFTIKINSIELVSMYGPVGHHNFIFLQRSLKMGAKNPTTAPNKAMRKTTQQSKTNQIEMVSEAWSNASSCQLTHSHFVLYCCDFTSVSIFDTIITCKTLEIKSIWCNMKKLQYSRNFWLLIIVRIELKN